MPSLEQIDPAFNLRCGAEAVIALLINHKEGSPQDVDPNHPLPTLYYALSLVYLRNVAIPDPDIDSNSKYIRYEIFFPLFPCELIVPQGPIF
jgi:hypothetical protein